MNKTKPPILKQPMNQITHTRLPQWANKLLASFPKTNRHNAIFTTALKLHPYFPDKDELCRVLEKATANCGRPVPSVEIEDAVYNSLQVAEGKVKQKRGPRWPVRNENWIAAVVHNGANLAQLSDLSPVKLNDDARHTEEIIDLLFPGNPLLCAGPRKNVFVTRTREEWRDTLEKQQFIVPNLMTATHGLTKAGQRSMRCLDNTGPRRFLVVESDTGNFDQHAAVLWHLAKSAPLVMCVHSGNKSLHGWFFVADEQEPAIEKFFRYAVSLGADPATWTRCQLVRMPDGQHDNGNRQRVVFFNPDPVKNCETVSTTNQ